MMSERLPLIAGNWKMHQTLAEAGTLAREIRQGIHGATRPEVVLAPPYTALTAVAAAIAGSPSASRPRTPSGSGKAPLPGPSRPGC